MSVGANRMIKHFICNHLLYESPIDGDVKATAEFLRTLAPLIKEFEEKGDDSEDACVAFYNKMNEAAKPFRFDPSIHKAA